MTTAFDPETGARIPASAPTTGPTVRTARRNPYETALAAIWISSAVLAFVLLLVGSAVASGQESSLPDPQGTALAASVAAAVFAVLAVLVGVAHLTARAITWRPPED